MEFIGWLASFWAILWTVLAVLVICALTEYERGWLALFALVAALALPELTGSFSVLDWIAERPGRLVGLAVLYVGAGVVWALMRWRIYVGRHWKEVTGLYESRKKSDVGSSFDAFVESDSNPLHPSRHKSRIGLWMAWWPFSMLSYLLKDWLAALWTRLYELTEVIFVRIMASVVKRNGNKF